MRKLLVAIGVGIALALLPAVVSAQEEADDVLIRIRSGVHVPRGESVGTVIVIDGGAQIDGTVHNSVLVVRGDVVISGTVEGNVTVINGSLRLTSGSRIENAYLFRSDLERASGSTVSGELRERERVFFRGFSAIASFLIWLAMTIAILVAGLVFAAIGGRQLRGSSNALTEKPGQSILAALILWIAVPVLAVVAMISLIGIPLGIGLLVFLLPALWFLGYIVVGTRIGTLVLGTTGRGQTGHPYLAVLIGVLTLQLVALLPVLGWFVLFLAGLWGAGGLAYFAFRGIRGEPTPAEASA
jgi:cytoskeletal protein CcmA (bactofilin family)